MGIVVIGAIFVDIKGFPLDAYIPNGRNAGRIEYIHGGVSRNVVEDIANIYDTINYEVISGIGEKSNAISNAYRSIHPSHMGRVDLDSSSNSDPGVSGTICPLTFP